MPQGRPDDWSPGQSWSAAPNRTSCVPPVYLSFYRDDDRRIEANNNLLPPGIPLQREVAAVNLWALLAWS